MTTSALPKICSACMNSDHGLCAAKGWCVNHPGMMPEHKATDLYQPIELQQDLFDRPVNPGGAGGV